MRISSSASYLLYCQALLKIISTTLVTLAGSLPCKHWDYASCYGASFRVLDWHVGATQDQWLDWKSFKVDWLHNAETDFDGKPYISVEVKEVPCKAYGCCNLQVFFRPNTTDYFVFEQVFPWHYFNFLYEMDTEPEYIIDAGANAGFSSMLFSLIFPKAKILAIEPDKDNFQILKLNTMRFGNIHAVNAGVWDKNVYITTAGQSLKWGAKFKEVDDPESKEGTLGLTISYLMKQFDFPRIDYAKIDVEGAEGVMFSSRADLSWLDHATFLSFELHDRYAPYYGLKQVSTLVRETMKAKGFEEDSDNEHYFFMRPKVSKHRSKT